LIIIKKQSLFGGGSCKVKVNNDTGSVVSAVKDAVALKELPIYYRHHIKKGLELGKIKDQKEEDKKNMKLIKQNLYVTRTLLRANN